EADSLRRIAVDRRLRLALDPAASHPAFRQITPRLRAQSRGADKRASIAASTRLALAEHALAPPTGTPRAIAALALLRTRDYGLDRRRGRRERRCRRTFILTQRSRCRLAHGRAPARRFGRGRFGKIRLRHLRRWGRLRLGVGRRRQVAVRFQVAVRLGDRDRARFRLAERCSRRCALGPGGLLEIRPAEFRLDGCISREAFALATGAVAPATARSAATAAALALAVRLRRLFEATHCGGLMRLLRPANIVFASCGSEVRGSLLREFLALLLERLFAATAAAPPAP